ncbi:serine protease snake-like [Planococcus citri]|uniref:serine protease snake-like n=1 Tax=Planococcus citri TaxID=170843 RepID=UPI0031F80BFE
MLRTCNSGSCDLNLLLVLVLVQFCYCQGQRIEDCRRFYGYNCVKFADCPTGPELVRNQIATLCGFENGGAKICCPSSKPPATPAPTPTPYRSPPTKPTQSVPVTRPTPTPTSTRPTPIKLTPATPTTTTKRPTPTPTTPTRKPSTRPTSRNATAIAISKCQEYIEYKYDIHITAPQLPGEEPQVSKRLNCFGAATLIVNGVPAESKEYPHMALIGYGNNFRNVEWACGGSLISEKFVLSAAHCGSSDRGEAKWALLGELNITTDRNRDLNMVRPKVYSIIRRFNHPNYRPPSVYNDITLFELNSTVEMSAFVRPACLYTSTSPFNSNPRQQNPTTSITGWGLTGAAERRSTRLLKARISFQDEDLCVTEYPSSTRLDHGYEATSMVCAGDLVTGNDTCPGDSGGPLQITISPEETCVWQVIGITSIGPGICGNLESPGIYTKVAYYLEWIQGIVWP